jgi:hypothetical protein
MIKLNSPQKKIGQNTGEEKQTLLSKKERKNESKLCQARFYIELTLFNDIG